MVILEGGRATTATESGHQANDVNQNDTLIQLNNGLNQATQSCSF